MTRSLALTFVVALPLFGCTTTRSTDTARTGVEQLLISNAVDQALDRYDFGSLEGQKVFIQDKYLDCTDKGYVLGSLRRRVLASGAHLVDAADGSSVTLEVASGGVGTDTLESYIGSPGVAVPGPMPVQLPEVRLVNRKTQYGTAKLTISAYATEDRRMLGLGGSTLARSDDNKWFVLGAGPFQNGSVRSEIEEATGENQLTADVAAWVPLPALGGGDRREAGRTGIVQAGPPPPSLEALRRREQGAALAANGPYPTTPPEDQGATRLASTFPNPDEAPTGPPLGSAPIPTAGPPPGYAAPAPAYAAPGYAPADYARAGVPGVPR